MSDDRKPVGDRLNAPGVQPRGHGCPACRVQRVHASGGRCGHCRSRRHLARTLRKGHVPGGFIAGRSPLSRVATLGGAAARGSLATMSAALEEVLEGRPQVLPFASEALAEWAATQVRTVFSLGCVRAVAQYGFECATWLGRRATVNRSARPLRWLIYKLCCPLL